MLITAECAAIPAAMDALAASPFLNGLGAYSSADGTLLFVLPIYKDRKRSLLVLPWGSGLQRRRQAIFLFLWVVFVLFSDNVTACVQASVLDALAASLRMRFLQSCTLVCTTLQVTARRSCPPLSLARPRASWAQLPPYCVNGNTMTETNCSSCTVGCTDLQVTARRSRPPSCPARPRASWAPPLSYCSTLMSSCTAGSWAPSCGAAWRPWRGRVHRRPLRRARCAICSWNACGARTGRSPRLLRTWAAAAVRTFPCIAHCAWAAASLGFTRCCFVAGSSQRVSGSL